ncbi:hypothetical protein L3Y34_017464 [Caenorhabditis briggsae]|uniref:Uncharacterized protein n=1 Tax=Caenorhabditis briggsae TaxID=6238 RepID=A0AAE9DIY9_CAEBR|nr:hypothetical protein L3Y34_017464 [Caenorhabditis briggsae]
MYLLILYNVINVIIISLALTINCLEAKKKGANATGSKNTLTKKVPPVSYEKDQKLLYEERKAKIVENRERMRKKREKQVNKAKLGSKEGSKESVKGPMVEKKKETELLPEDKTQPTTHSTDSLEFMMPEKTDLKMNKTQPLEDDKTKESKEEIKGSSDEELGEVQLVDHDPDAEMKKEAVKKQAREVAHQKQLAELMEKSLERSESMNPTPDDTMKNVSSIHNESELPEIQKKKRKDYESELIEPKSNPMYLREFTEKVMGGSVEKIGRRF